MGFFRVVPLVVFFVFSCARKAPEKITPTAAEERIRQEKMEIVRKAEKLGFEEAKAVVAPDPYIMFGLALRKEKGGDLEEASKFYSYAIELKPNMAEAWINLAEVRHKMGYPEEKIRILEEALRIVPDDPRTWAALAMAYAEFGNTKKAEEVVSNAINSVGMKKEVAQALGYTFFISKRYSLALFVFSELLSKHPDDPDMYFIIGDIYMKTKNPERAREYFERGVRLKQDEVALNKLGLCYFTLGAVDNAKEAFEKAISVNRNYWPAYVNLGLILKRKNDFENAEKMYLKALELNRDNPDIIYNLANLYETYASYTRANPQKSLENIGKAREFLAMYSQYVSDETERQAIQNRINKLRRSEDEMRRQLEREIKKLEKRGREN